MLKRITVLLIFIVTLPHFIFSQEKEKDENETNSKWPSVEIGTGILRFNGDVGKGDRLSSLSKINSGSYINIEKRFGNYFGLSLSSLYGTLSASNRFQDFNYNFQSKISQTNLNLIFHFDNDLIIKRFAVVAPFISVGIGFLKFDPYGDLKDQNGNPYNYWSDGGIYTLPENSPNPYAAKIVKRDYTYETRLTDSSVNYARHTFAIPITAGVKLKITPSFHFNITASYYYTFSDYVDNVKAHGNNDSYIYLSVGLVYSIGARKKDDPSAAVDFSALDNMDSDNDGIKDIDDNCQGTPKGAVVDLHGCPLDTDEDGVPDYKDKEANTKKGALVDEKGVTLTTKMLKERYQKWQTPTPEKPTEKITTTHFPTNIPDEFKYADIDNDGHITVKEINIAVYNFFEDPDSKITQNDLKKLIDYYFSAE